MINIEKELKRAKKEKVQPRWALWALSQGVLDYRDKEKLKNWEFMSWIHAERVPEFKKITSELEGSEEWQDAFTEYLINYVKEII